MATKTHDPAATEPAFLLKEADWSHFNAPGVEPDWKSVRRHLKNHVHMNRADLHRSHKWTAFTDEVANIEGFDEQQKRALRAKQPVEGFADAVIRYFGVEANSAMAQALRKGEENTLRSRFAGEEQDGPAGKGDPADLKSEEGLPPRISQEELQDENIPFARSDTGYSAREARRRVRLREDAQGKPSEQQGNRFEFVRAVAANIRADRQGGR